MITEVLTPSRFGACDTEGKLRRADAGAVEWIVSEGQVPYPDALAAMRARAAAIAEGTAPEAVWLLEHPPLYTAGTSAEPKDLLDPDRFPVYDAGRGGEYTYHGPGQRVAYLMLDLRERGRDVRCLVRGLEGWLIDTLGEFNITGERREGRIGVWVRRPDKGFAREDKIAAIGVRVSRWVTFHGIALNVSPDLSHFGGIVPCGITDQGVTSFEDLGQLVSMPEVDSALKAAFEHRFGRTAASPAESLVSPASAQHFSANADSALQGSRS
jgi:lipoyl(octanoyl) transferase